MLLIEINQFIIVDVSNENNEEDNSQHSFTHRYTSDCYCVRPEQITFSVGVVFYCYICIL